jgi:hypothetical protein
MHYDDPLRDGPTMVPVLINTVSVIAYNGVAGDDFRVYFQQQRPHGLTVPYTEDLPYVEGLYRQGAPQRGLDNQAAWDTYRIAIAGAIAPCQLTRPEIQGFVCH